MTIRASDQITIVDLTDGYTVILTNESHTFPGSTSAAKAGSATTQVVAMQGKDSVPCTVTVSEITKPTGVTISSDGDKTAPTLTIAVTTSVTTAGTITIPVHIDDITINKVFSYSIAFTGAQGVKGSPGTNGTNGKDGTNGTNGTNGQDALTIIVTSSNGTIFKNTAIQTTLTAHVFKGPAEVTGSALTALGTLKWYKDGATTAAATGTSLTIDAGSVTDKASYTVQLEA